MSIFSQTYPHWEWVIVDDGSTDNSLEILERFASRDNRVKILQRQREPKGACSCRNIAVENATGQYLIFLDTDDLLASFCLQQRVEAMQHDPGNDFIIFQMLLFKNRPNDLGLLWNIDKPMDEVDRLLMGDPVCQGTGTIWDKQSFIKLGIWREDLKLWQDIELHLRSFLQDARFKKRMDLPPDIFLRVSDISLSRTGYHSLLKLQSRITVFKSMAETIFHKQKTALYHDGLRNMAHDLIVNTICSGYHLQLKQLLDFCRANDIFSKSDVAVFLNYFRVRKWKLYKFPVLEKIYRNRVNEIVPTRDSSLGKIKYQHPIRL